ncbi:MAG: PIN domain-containing protein [Lentisphaerota bacterium]
MKVFLDANILFSSSNPQSATRFLLDIILSKYEAVANEHVMEEARRNLKIKRSSQEKELIILCSKITLTSAFTMIQIPSLPDKDIPVISGAVGSKCTHLWTGDKKHFSNLYGKTVYSVKVVSSIMLAEELL